ncbi:MAG: hypothetical protein GY774_26430 [Planctomycetes bacterium]|nr:hypothetical protein [Planctomycetota bacterium]
MTMKNCPMFICYRQTDGKKIAQWLYHNLNGKSLPDIGHVETEEKASSLDVYFDQTAPAVGDWKAIHHRNKLCSVGFLSLYADRTIASCTYPSIDLQRGYGLPLL